MEVDISQRQAGKTTRMIKWLRGDEGRMLITFSHQRENQMKREYKDVANRILDWRSFQDRYAYAPATREIKELGIDDADMILNNLFEGMVTRISITGTNKTKI